MRVSIVINNYNYAEFVQISVESALRQNYEQIEIIVVDDGSQDDSLQVLRTFGPPVTIVTKSNGGQGSAYNLGFERSSGDIVMFLDADDWLYPSAVSLIVDTWRQGVAKVQFPLTLVDRRGVSLNRQVPRLISDEGALDLLRQFGAYYSPPGSGNAYSADFLRKILPMNEAQWRIAADTVPISLAPAYGDVVSIPQALGAYRLHRRSDDDSLLMNNAPANLWHEYDRIEKTKRFVENALLKLGLNPRMPLLLAPWEARVAVLCVRFGGDGRKPFDGSKMKIAWFALHSLWRWPHWSMKKKAVQSVWMILVLLLPNIWARGLALKHKASVGLPTQPPSTLH
jgi:glycosyltransferase involved in cell wall biosynthesis